VTSKNRIMIYGPKNDGYARSSTHSKRMDPCHEKAAPIRYRCAADGYRDSARLVAQKVAERLFAKYIRIALADISRSVYWRGAG
jgi:hypothetical protein